MSRVPETRKRKWLAMSLDSLKWPVLCKLAAFELGFGYLWAQFFAWFSHVMLGLLHEAQHGIHMGISFPPCSAAVRAQHMESMFQKTFIFSELFNNFF